MREQRRAEHVRAQRTRHSVNGHTWQPLQILGDAMRDEVDLTAAAGQILCKAVIGAIHPAKRREVAGGHEPRPHVPSVPRREATPWRAPARNQY